MLSLSDLAEEYDDLRMEQDESGGDELDSKRMKQIQELATELGYDNIENASRGESPDLIEEGDFEDYIRDEAEAMTDVDMSVWPFNCIDWERAASDAQTDYSSVEFDGDTYYYRG